MNDRSDIHPIGCICKTEMNVRFFSSAGEWIDVPVSDYYMWPIHGTEYNGPRFTHDRYGNLIPLSRRPLLQGQITRVSVPANYLVTFYSDVGCVDVTEKVAGTYLSTLGEPSSGVGDYTLLYPDRVRGIGITNPRALTPAPASPSPSQVSSTSSNSTSKGVPIWAWIIIGVMAVIVFAVMGIMLFKATSHPIDQSVDYAQASGTQTQASWSQAPGIQVRKLEPPASYVPKPEPITFASGF